jgi:hypothetical protein
MQTLSTKNLFFIKYGLLVLNLFLMIMSIRTYVNYSSILLSIDNVKHQITQLDKEIAFLEHIERPFLNSPYALEFLAHESNKLLPRERFVQLLDEAPSEYLSTWETRDDDIVKTIGSGIIYSSSQQARREYLWEAWIQAWY